MPRESGLAAWAYVKSGPRPAGVPVRRSAVLSGARPGVAAPTAHGGKAHSTGPGHEEADHGCRRRCEVAASRLGELRGRPRGRRSGGASDRPALALDRTHVAYEQYAKALPWSAEPTPGWEADKQLHSSYRSMACQTEGTSSGSWTARLEGLYRRTAEISPPGRSPCCGRVLIGRP